MADRKWAILQISLAVMIMSGAFILTFFLQNGGLQPVLTDPVIKWSIIMVFLVAMYIIVLAEIRKRRKEMSLRTIGITTVVFFFIGVFFWLIR